MTADDDNYSLYVATRAKTERWILDNGLVGLTEDVVRDLAHEAGLTVRVSSRAGPLTSGPLDWRTLEWSALPGNPRRIDIDVLDHLVTRAVVGAPEPGRRQ